MVRLRDLGTWVGGNTPSKANPAYWTEGTVPWVSPKDMKVHEITSSEDRITELALADGRVSMIPAGSVLFVTRSGILSHTVPVAITKLPVTINQDLKALTPKEGVSPKYVAHAIRGASQRILRDCAKNGTTVASIETSRLLDFEIPIGGMSEQLEIVAEIEKQFSRLDEAVANLQRVKANLKRYKTSVLKDAVEGRLVPTEAELARREDRTFETGEQLLQRILAARRKDGGGRGKCQDPGALDAVLLPALPVGWTWATYRQLGDVTTGFTPPTGDAENFGGDIPFFKPTDLDVGENVTVAREYLSEKGIAKGRLLKADSVLVTCIGATIGKTGLARVDCATNQQINAITLSQDGVIPLFVYHWTVSLAGQAQILDNSSATTLPILNKSKFEALSVPLPPQAEQKRIVVEIGRRLSLVRGVEVEVDANLKRAGALRRSTLSRAFSS